jgi:hypothetical protein
MYFNQSDRKRFVNVKKQEMADHIENKEMKALPILPNGDLRAKLKSGDIFLLWVII